MDDPRSAPGQEPTIGAPPVAADYPAMVTVDPQHYVLADEIARGGMGRIRIARDRRLGRTIALKEILVNRGDVALRFEREARITARLEHPAIVSVHEAGSWPTGEPFIAMRLVKGRSLDEVIAEATTLGARMALLPNVLAVADAIAYAHEQQIVHRDLKPKNVLVGKFGETVVIDWGLAKDRGELEPEDSSPAPHAAGTPVASPIISGTEETLGSESPPNSAMLTADGSVMGTPAYMPPEQALGERVDERADVYAIGAMLYHVLSGRAPIQSKAAALALEDVIAGRIEPLAALEPETPPDLLAIVTKSMAPRADDRYPSARELADDLRRFQTGQLVGAHRYSTRELIRKWIRRHRTALTTVAIALGVLAVLGVIAVRRIVRERETAEAQRVRAEESRADSDALVQFMLGDLREQLAPMGRLDVIDKVTERAVDYYKRRDTRSAKHATALATRSAVLEEQGNLAGALEAIREAIEIRRAIRAADPASPGALELVASYRKASDLLAKQGELVESLAVARGALDLAGELAKRDPANERELGFAHKKVGDVLRAQGDRAGALAAYRSALVIRERVARAAPEQPGLQRDLASNHERIGFVLKEQGDLTGALAAYRAALAISETLPAREPKLLERWRDVAILHTRIGDALQQLGDHGAALVEYRKALAIPERLAAENPTNVQWQRDLSIARLLIGDLLLATGDRTGALVEYRADLAIAKRLAAQDPTNVEWQRDLAVSHEKVGNVALAGGDTTAALAELEASLAILRRLADQDPTNQRWRPDLAGTYQRLGDVHTARGDTQRAKQAYSEAARLAP